MSQWKQEVCCGDDNATRYVPGAGLGHFDSVEQLESILCCIARNDGHSMTFSTAMAHLAEWQLS
jgi:hypothetical protein